MNWLFRHTSDESRTKGLSTGAKKRIARGLEESRQHNINVGAPDLRVAFGRKTGIRPGVAPHFARASGASTTNARGDGGAGAVAPPRTGAGLLST